MNKRISVCVVFTCLIALVACRTTNSIAVDNAAATGLYDALDDYVSPAADDDGNRYLFVRLYDPKYKNPFYMSNLLKVGIAATEVHKPLRYSHASLGFDLTDAFYGLTLMPRPMLNTEQCTDAPSNEFMKQCRMDRSTQATYALLVSADEYDNAKHILFACRDAKYSVGRVFASAVKALKRKCFHTKRNRCMERALFTRKGTATVAAKMGAKRKFTCSAFVAYVLYRSCNSVRTFFDDNNTNINYVSVTDLAFLPGIEQLFTSTWEDYNAAAESFAATHEEFAQYWHKAQDTADQ